jgi:DNA repair protein RadC
MSIKLTAQQKSKPIYTSQDAMHTAWPAVWDIIHPIYMRENKMRRQKEYFWLPCLPAGRLGIDRERYLQVAELLAHAYSLAGIGSDNRVHIKPADAFKAAIYKNADYVIFIHNPRLTERGRHPKGKLEPSASDKDTTNRLMKAGEVVEIKIVDHFIINEAGYYSFEEAGLMKQLRQSKTYTVLHEDEVELLKMQMEVAGIAKGKEEGLKEGKELGKVEGLKEVAKRLLELGQSVELVMQATGLGKKMVGKLKK